MSTAGHDIDPRKCDWDFWSRQTFGDVASVAIRGIGTKNAIENFLKSTKLWRCCECRYSKIGRRRTLCRRTSSLKWQERPSLTKNISVLWNFGPIHSALYEIRTWWEGSLKIRTSRLAPQNLRSSAPDLTAVTILAREMRLKIFENDQALEMLRVSLVTILAQEMWLKTTKLSKWCECR